MGLSQNCFLCPDPAFVNAWQHRIGAVVVVVVVAYWLGELPYTTSIHPPSSPQSPYFLFPQPIRKERGRKKEETYASLL